MASDPRITRSRGGRSPGEPAAQAVPEVGRPPRAKWAAMERDGVHWEGQVLIAGAGTHLPARLILTRSRLVLSTERAIALDVPRAWLRPQPMLLHSDPRGEPDGDAVRLSVTPDGAPNSTERLVLRTRGGRGAAAQLVRVITGRMAPAPTPERPTVAEIHPSDTPAWSERIGAATPIALPPLPDLPDDDTERRPWPPMEQGGLPSARSRQQADAPRTRTVPERNQRAEGRSPAPHALTGAAPAGPLAGSPLATGTSTAPSDARTWHATPGTDDDERTIAFVAAEPHQFNRALVWGLRTLILAILVGTGVYFGGDRFALPANLDFELPSEIESRLGISGNEDDTAQIAADLGQTGSNGSRDSADDVSNAVTSDGTSGAPSGDPGVGGTTSVLPTTEPLVEENVATEEPAPTEVPAPTDVLADTGGTDDDAIDDDSTGGGGDLPAAALPAPTDVPADVVPTDEPEPEPAAIPTEEPTAVPTEIPTAVPTQEPTPAPTQEPTAVPTPTPTAAPTQEPTAVPTPTPAPTAVPTPTPTAVPTQEPTAIPTPTPMPTTVPTLEPTAVPTTLPTQAPPTEPTLESLPPSVDPETPPAQAVANGSFRFSIEGAAIGDTIEELPEVTDVGTYGEWVVLSLYGENWSGSEQVFDMSQFTLLADGEEISLDVGNSWVASQLGFTPAYGNTDAVLWASGEGHALALTFLVPPGTETLELRTGDQVIDLGRTFESPGALAQETGPAEPEYLEARVIEVVDGETIIIEKDGVRQEVGYLGIDAPTGDDCHAAAATAANAGLVEGKTVRVERQATDVDAQGNWVRDVWVETEAGQGQFLLVSEALVGEGAAEADVTEPNTRFSGWLTAAQSSAQAEGDGLWSACEPEASGPSSQLEAMTIPPSRLTARRIQAHRE